MRHSTSRTAADRHASGLGRTVFEEADDSKPMQESKHSLFKGEQQQKIEHVHPYGFTAVPKKPTGSGVMRRAAEAFMSFLGGNRSHGIAVVVGDRRYRLYKLEEGEVALHDDQGQQVHLKRDGVWASVPNSKQIKMQIMDDDQMPQDSSGGSGGSGQQMGQIKQAGRPAQINFTLDKNGLTVNHPNGAVQFNCKTFKATVSDHFSTVGETRLGSDSASDPVYGKNHISGRGQVTTASGGSSVLVDAPLPGPPTSLDLEP